MRSEPATSMVAALPCVMPAMMMELAMPRMPSRVMVAMAIPNRNSSERSVNLYRICMMSVPMRGGLPGQWYYHQRCFQHDTNVGGLQKSNLYNEVRRPMRTTLVVFVANC